MTVAKSIAERVVPEIRGGNAAGLVTVYTEMGTQLVSMADAIRKRRLEVERVESIVADELQKYFAQQEDLQDAAA